MAEAAAALTAPGPAPPRRGDRVDAVLKGDVALTEADDPVLRWNLGDKLGGMGRAPVLGLGEYCPEAHLEEKEDGTRLGERFGLEELLLLVVTMASMSSKSRSMALCRSRRSNSLCSLRSFFRFS